MCGPLWSAAVHWQEATCPLGDVSLASGAVASSWLQARLSPPRTYLHPQTGGQRHSRPSHRLSMSSSPLQGPLEDRQRKQKGNPAQSCSEKKWSLLVTAMVSAEELRGHCGGLPDDYLTAKDQNGTNSPQKLQGGFKVRSHLLLGQTGSALWGQQHAVPRPLWLPQLSPGTVLMWGGTSSSPGIDARSSRCHLTPVLLLPGVQTDRRASRGARLPGTGRAGCRVQGAGCTRPVSLRVLLQFLPM